MPQIRCVIMRGGTSKAVFLRANDLPPEGPARDRVILQIFGSPDKRQIDGLGGVDPVPVKDGKPVEEGTYRGGLVRAAVTRGGLHVSGRAQLLAEFVSGLRYEDVPLPVVERIKWSLLDTIGCGLYGSLTPWGRIATRYATRVQGKCGVWGSALQTDAANAALVNGTIVHSFELDDIHTGARLHPGAVTVPVALALAAEEGGLSGRELITALAAGYEATIRVGICQGKSAFHRGWHPTGTAGIFGSAATAARLLRLPPDATLHCLGVAGTMPAGLMAAQYGAMVKRLFAGHAAMAGVIACRLAADGFTGITDIFDAEFGGYPKALSDETELEVLTDGLGSRYETLQIGYKFYACVGTNFTALDAVKELLAATGAAPAEIEQVNVRTSDYQKVHSGWDYVPSTIMGAQMNMQFCIAAMAYEGEVFVDQFTEESIRAPHLLDLASRVRVEVDPAIDALPPHYRTAEVELVYRGGRKATVRKDFARGHARNLPTWDEVVAKFRRLASRVVSEERVAAIIRSVETVETAENVQALARLLTTGVA